MSDIARLEPLCSTCSAPTGLVILSRTESGWVLNATGLGTQEAGVLISDERAALVQAAIDDPTGPDRLWSAGLDEGLGLCLRCNAFYCQAHWRAGYCPRGHLMSIDI